MHRFHLPPAACRGSTLTLADREAHHALHVLRVQPGDRVAVLDGAGREFLCDVAETTRHEVRLAVRHATQHPPLPRDITLIQAVTKSRSMDWVVQKATELGTRRIIPVIADRSVPRLDSGAADRATKWQEIAVEALKQCGTPWLPRIEPPEPLASSIARTERFPLSLLASLQPGAQHPREVLKAYAADHGAPPKAAAVWIGPEGDFTPAEMLEIRATGAQPITLGPLVLRSETAAVYCLAFLAYELNA
ncbi:MAG TPA: RsmE family RNA methyltransferase [Verrucomicrobiota bacterium]|nr:RsmE family RNA methyltransferase [Verrucomicrobiota bacterium]HNU50423.1 RsmE family RNA methyltransferase [Verrucomicrobiota bacterium]